MKGLIWIRLDKYFLIELTHVKIWQCLCQGIIMENTLTFRVLRFFTYLLWEQTLKYLNYYGQYSDDGIRLEVVIDYLSTFFHNVRLKSQFEKKIKSLFFPEKINNLNQSSVQKSQYYIGQRKIYLECIVIL